MSVRVWVPATVDELAAWWADRSVPAREGHAVTAALREAWPDGGDEEWEYAVLLAAAEHAASLLRAPGRRVVVVVDADAVEEDQGTTVRLTAPVPWQRLAAVHADPPGTTVPPAGPDTVPDVAAGQDAPELCWYAVQEVPAVLGEAAD
ncbi:MAG TPA: hypothetical protein VFM09_03955 [Marmoricola sp.]|nr:hypothetical protein [Marmoricola sp.]